MLENESKRKESESYGLEFPVTFTGKEAVVSCPFFTVDPGSNAFLCSLIIAQDLTNAIRCAVLTPFTFYIPLPRISLLS